MLPVDLKQWMAKKSMEDTFTVIVYKGHIYALLEILIYYRFVKFFAIVIQFLKFVSKGNNGDNNRRY